MIGSEHATHRIYQIEGIEDLKSRAQEIAKWDPRLAKLLELRVRGLQLLLDSSDLLFGHLYEREYAKDLDDRDAR